MHIFNIIFSVLLLPINLICSFWLFDEVLKLSKMTFRGFLNQMSGKVPSATGGSTRMRSRSRRRRMGIILKYLLSTSSDPDLTLSLFYRYCWSTIPGFFALGLAGYSAYLSQSPNKNVYALLGNIALLAVNIALVLAGIMYRQKHPLDKDTAELLEKQRQEDRKAGQKHRTKNIIVYTLVIGFFLGFILFFYFFASNATSSPQTITSSNQVEEVIDNTRVYEVLENRGFETANIATTYWSYDQEKLMYVAPGIKEDIRFEFYEYSNDETIEDVYYQIIEDITSNSAEESHEQDLSGGGKLFTVNQDNVLSVVLYQGETLVYACSLDTSHEIEEILDEIGYI